MITVEGYSDDLVEIEGDASDEIEAYDNVVVVNFDNGAALAIAYVNGVWRIRALALPELIEITRAPDDDEDNYTDRAVVATAKSFTYEVRNG